MQSQALKREIIAQFVRLSNFLNMKQSMRGKKYLYICYN